MDSSDSSGMPNSLCFISKFLQIKESVRLGPAVGSPKLSKKAFSRGVIFRRRASFRSCASSSWAESDLHPEI